jgi:uncharacterized protein involved in exopolysaccharide biosynthesis
MQQANAPDAESAENEVTLLDLAITLAENVKLLVIGPVIAGLIALGTCFLVPETYESVAILRGDQVAAQLLTTTPILDATAARIGITAIDKPGIAREKLLDRIKTELDINTKLLTLKVAGRTPQEAQLTAQSLLQQLFLQSVPKTEELTKLEKQLEYTRQRAKLVESATSSCASALSNLTNATKVGTEYKELLNLLANANREVYVLETRLSGINDTHVIQAPDLPANPTQPKKLRITIASVVASAFLLAIYVLIRESVRNTKGKTAAKLARLRKALGIKDSK